MNLHRVKTISCIFILFLFMSACNDVNAAITTPSSCPATLPSGWVNVDYPPFTFEGTNGTGKPWSYSVNLPAGMSLDATTGVMSGRPSVAGSYTFTIEHKETGNKTSTCQCTLIIKEGCVFNGTSTGSIAFGVIDPAGYPTPIQNTVTQQVNFQCSANSSYSVAVTNPTGTLQLTGANTIPFTLGLAAGGVGSGAVDIPLLTTTSEITNYGDLIEGVSSFSNPITVAINWTGGSISAYVNVSDVTVIPSCGTPTNGTINFEIDPSLTTTITAATTVNGTSPSVKCTKASQPNVSCATSSGGTAGQLKKGLDTIPYNVTTCGVSGKITGNGFGPAGATAVPVAISIAPSAYQTAPVGDYSDTITVTISY